MSASPMHAEVDRFAQQLDIYLDNTLVIFAKYPDYDNRKGVDIWKVTDKDEHLTVKIDILDSKLVIEIVDTTPDDLHHILNAVKETSNLIYYLKVKH